MRVLKERVSVIKLLLEANLKLSTWTLYGIF